MYELNLKKSNRVILVNRPDLTPQYRACSIIQIKTQIENKYKSNRERERENVGQLNYCYYSSNVVEKSIKSAWFVKQKKPKTKTPTKHSLSVRE